MEFPKSIFKDLKFYVYIYSDPDTNEIFYVGKGKENRVFSHLNDENKNEKTEKIKEISNKGKKPKIEILVHGIEEKTALKVESAIIDLVGKEKLTNKVLGLDSGNFGRMGIDQIINMYNREKVEINDPVLLVKLNKYFRYDMSPQELYDTSRSYWKVNKDNVEKVKYVLAVYDGIVQEVYSVTKWFEAYSTFNTVNYDNDFSDRMEFVGTIADEKTRKKYLGKSVENHFSDNQQNPIKYINCSNN